MAALSILLEQARELRRQNTLLRMEMARLTEQVSNRDRLPAWPAWSGPTPELRLTLVRVE